MAQGARGGARAVTRGWKIGLAIVGGLVALNVVLHVVNSLSGGTPGGPTSSAYATGRDGLAGYDELLRRARHRVRRIRESAPGAKLDPGSTAVLLDPVSFSARDGRALRRFVQRGGRLITGGADAGWLVRVLPDAPEWSADAVRAAWGRSRPAGGSHSPASVRRRLRSCSRAGGASVPRSPRRASCLRRAANTWTRSAAFLRAHGCGRRRSSRCANASASGWRRGRNAASTTRHGVRSRARSDLMRTCWKSGGRWRAWSGSTCDRAPRPSRGRGRKGRARVRGRNRAAAVGAPRRRPRPARGRTGSSEDAPRKRGRPRARPRVPPRAVHAGHAPVRPDRDADAARGRARLSSRPRLHERPPRR